jgi:hypothetical protein
VAVAKSPRPLKRNLKQKKQTSDELSKLAAQVLGGKTPTKKEVQSLAGSVLSQDETKGPRKKK